MADPDGILLMTPATRERLPDIVEEGLAAGVPAGKTAVFVGSDDIVQDETGAPKFHPDLMKAFDQARIDPSVHGPALEGFIDHNGGASAYTGPDTSILAMPTASEDGMLFTTDIPSHIVNSGSQQPERIPGTENDRFLLSGDHEMDHFENTIEIPPANYKAIEDFIAGVDERKLEALRQNPTSEEAQSFMVDAYKNGEIPTRRPEYESDTHANARYAEHLKEGRATDPYLPDYQRWTRTEGAMMDGFPSDYTVNGLSPLAGETPLTPHEIPVAETEIVSAAQRVHERIDSSILDTMDDQGEFDADKQRLKAQVVYQETRRALAEGKLDDLPYGKKVAERFVEGAERYAPEYYGVAPEDVRNDPPQMPAEAYGRTEPTVGMTRSTNMAPASP